MRSYVLSIVTPLNSSPNTSQIHNHLPTAPSLYHLNSWIIHWAQIVVPIWFWAWYWLSTGVCTTLKHNWIILYQKQSTAVTSVLPFYLLAGVLIGLVLCRHCANSPNHCELMSVSPCHVLETLFHVCPLQPLDIRIFEVIPESWGCDPNLLFMAEQSTDSFHTMNSCELIHQSPYITYENFSNEVCNCMHL